jgi:hypothetical protein
MKLIDSATVISTLSIQLQFSTHQFTLKFVRQGASKLVKNSSFFVINLC